MSARRRVVLLLAVLVVLGAAGGVWWFGHGRAATPPEISLEGADPEVAEAITAARREVLASPRVAERWGRLGMLLRAHAFGDEANACFLQAERLDPSEARWPYYRGLTLVLTEPAEGLACLRRAVDLQQDGALAPQFRLVEVLLEQGLLDEARQRLHQALELQPDHPRGLLLRGRLAYARQDWKTALAAAEACLNDPRSRKQAHRLAAEACRRLGDPARAERLAERGRQLPEDAPWPDALVAEVERLQVGLRVRLAQAEQLDHAGRGDEAVRLLNEVLRERPGEAGGWLLLGQVLRRQNRLQEAERALQNAVEAEGGAEAWFQLGVARALLGNKAAAAAAFREVVQRKPDHVLAYHNLAVCLQEVGDLEGARKAWQQALRCQPDYAPARQALEEAAKKPGT